jgi:hypothetical protein
MRSRIFHDQTTGSWLLIIISSRVVRAETGLRVGIRVRFFLGEQLIERLARPFFRLGRAESLTSRPPVRRHDPLVQQIIARIAVEGVRRPEHAIIFEVTSGRIGWRIVHLVVRHDALTLLS